MDEQKEYKLLMIGTLTGFLIGATIGIFIEQKYYNENELLRFCIQHKIEIAECKALKKGEGR